MSLEISLVPPDMVPGVLDRLRDKLAKAAEITLGRVHKEDIISYVLDGYYQLWVIFNPEDMDIEAALLTEIKRYPRSKWLCVQHCVGDQGSLQNMGEKMMKLLEKFAQTEKCAGVEFVGRVGWDKFAHRMGYEKRSVVYQKTFN